MGQVNKTNNITKLSNGIQPVYTILSLVVPQDEGSSIGFIPSNYLQGVYCVFIVNILI